jgi:uncharacterized protein (TIGR02598 family)
MSVPRQEVITMAIHRKTLSSRSRQAFSLVEVVLAIGVVSFAMMAMLGTLPVGLKSSQQSRSQVATANIARQLQGELQQLSFSAASADTLTVQNLANTPFYFTLEGTRTTDAAEAYYEASFAVNGVTVPGLTVDPANARSVTVTLTHPLAAPLENRQETIFSLLLAKQKTD